MTRPSLASIEQRIAAATKGPWVSADCTDEESDWYDDYDGPMVVTQDSTPGVYTAICKDFWEEGAGPANARLVAAARTDLPALAAAVRDMLAVADQFDRLAARHPDSETGHVETAAAHEIRRAVTAHIDTTPKETP